VGAKNEIRGGIRADKHRLAGFTGCVAAGDTREAERLIRDAFAFHLEGLRQSDEPIPQSGTWTGTGVVSE